MTDQEKITQLIEATQLSIREFALSVGLDNGQPIYDILNGKYGISRRMARMISAKYPHLVSFEDLSKGGQVQIANKGVNIQANNSKINMAPENTESLKIENQMLRETVKRLERELDEYRAREKTFLSLISHEAKKS
jgi:hypothetical protein